MNRNICLCYTDDLGLHTREFMDCDNSIFVTHNIKGRKTHTIEIPDGHHKVQIHSNFNFGQRSYLYATIERDGRSLLEFENDKIGVLNHGSVTEFTACTEDWETLLKKIVVACNTLPNICPASAIKYVDELGKILTEETINVKGAYHNETPSTWKDKFLVTLHIGTKIRDLIEGLKVADLEDEILTERLLGVCELFMQNLKELDIAPDDRRLPQLAAALGAACDFMATHGHELQLLKLFHGTIAANEK